MDAVNLQGVWPNFPTVKVAAPKKQVKKFAKVGGRRGGGSFLSPTEPLYSPSPCPPWKPSQDLLKKITSGKLKRTEPDPLEVLRDVRKTEERVKKSELRALRRRVAKLTKEASTLQTSKQEELQLAFTQIHKLERQLVCLQQDMLKWEQLRWAPARWRPYQPQPTKAPEVKPEIVTVMVAADPVPLQEWPVAMAIKAGLPYLGVSIAAALGTHYLIPDDKKTLKFMGYNGAIVVLLIGMNAALDSALDITKPKTSPAK